MFLTVNKKKKYDFNELSKNLEAIKARYPFCHIFSIGESHLKNPIYCIKIGNGENKVFYNGAHHGAEWITSALLMKFLEDYAKAYIDEEDIGNISAKYLFYNTTLYIIPMVNPDGVNISINGARIYSGDFPRLFKENHNSSNFEKWQANFMGVDLNHNYDALWELSRDGEKEHNILGPGPTRYAGAYPFSEPETIAISNFCINEDFKLAMAFHSQGQEIYYNFNKSEPIYSKFIADAISQGTPYKTATPEGIASYGGFKDWFISTFKRLCFTIEIGQGENPLPISDLDNIYRETLPILVGGMRVSCLI